MRFVFRLVVLLAVFALALAAHHFYLHRTVKIEFEGVVAEPNLSILLIGFAFLMLTVYLLIRLVLFVVFLPRHIRQWRRRRLGHKQDRLLEESLRALAMGEDAVAERKLSLLAEAGMAVPEAYLLAAECALEQGLKQRHIALLNKAASANSDASPVGRLVAGRLAMAGERHADALNELRAVEGTTPKARRVLEFAAECNERLGDSSSALMNRMALARLSTAPGGGMLARVVALLGQVGDQALIAELHKEESGKMAKDIPAFAVGLARRLAALGMETEADALLRRQIKGGPGHEVLEAVAEIGSEHLVDAAIEAGEKAHAGNSQRAPLLRALGRLYTRKSLWKKARENIEAALLLSPDAETHAAMAELLKETGAPPDEVLAQHERAEAARRAAHPG